MQESVLSDAYASLGHHNDCPMSYSGTGYGGAGSRANNDEQPLARYWNVLRERIWVIVACTVLVFLAAVVYVELAPRTYQAQAEMEVQAAGSGDAVLSALPVLHQTGDPTEDVLTAASLVTTQPVAQAVVQSLPPHLKISPGAALADVQATPIGQAGLVAVQATTSSPALSKALANGFVEQTIALSTARMHEAIARELPTLQAQVAAVPAGQRYGAGSLGAQLDELQQLLLQNDPTLASAAPATLPTAPSSPKVKLSLIAGLFAGLLVGIGAAFLFHTLDPRLRREEQLRDRFAMPVLARIPRQPHRSRPILPNELLPRVQEGYRTLRAIMSARNRSGESRAVLVTGSAPSEGKSTTAMGLAAALADAGARVVLIEADLRKPTFASSFRLSGFIGIESVLDGTAELSEAILTVPIHEATVQVLAAHPAERPPHLPFPIVEKLVEDAKLMADFVVIDSAPLAMVIDALPFAQAADDVLIVSRLGETRLNKLDELDDLLSRHGVNRTGIVLIGERPERDLGYYNYGSAPEAPPGRAEIAPRRSGKAVH